MQKSHILPIFVSPKGNQRQKNSPEFQKAGVLGI